MSRQIYDNWEKLVVAVVRKQQYLELCSLSDVSSEAGSSFRSLSITSTVYDDMPRWVDSSETLDKERSRDTGQEREKVVADGQEIVNLVILDDIISRLLELRNALPTRQVQLSEDEIRSLCIWSRGIFLSQPNLLELEAPIKICGDIHGQYGDLVRIFEYGGFPSHANYLFSGNYVDNGRQSIETICLLLAYKIKYPLNFFLLRGNHECASINRIHGFYDECRRRFNVRLWKTFTDCFNCLPVAAVVDDKIFCVHGGLSPDLMNLDQIRNLPRPTDVPDSGLLCDLLWSDPTREIRGWGMNDRGVSYTFGPDKVDEFIRIHDMDLVCRGHQVVEDGYEFFADRQLVTIFSAPNYCGEYDNAGAIMSIDETLMCSFQILKPGVRNRFAKQVWNLKPGVWNRFTKQVSLQGHENQAITPLSYHVSTS